MLHRERGPDAAQGGKPGRTEVLPETPENIGGVLDAGIRLYRAHFSLLTRIAALFFGAGLAINLFAVLALGVNFMPSDPTTATPGELYTPPVIGFSLVGFFVSTLAYAALFRQLQACASGTTLTVSESVRQGLSRMIPLTVSLVLYILLVGAGFLLLVIPGIWLATAAGFTLIFAADDSGPVAAIRQSFRLVHGHWWRTTAVFAVIFLLVFVVSFVFGALPGAVAGFNAAAGDEVPMRTFQLISMIGNAVASTFMIPIGFSMTYAAYHDLKLRKSGEDLESRLGTLEV